MVSCQSPEQLCSRDLQKINIKFQCLQLFLTDLQHKLSVVLDLCSPPGAVYWMNQAQVLNEPDNGQLAKDPKLLQVSQEHQGPLHFWWVQTPHPDQPPIVPPKFVQYTVLGNSNVHTGWTFAVLLDCIDRRGLEEWFEACQASVTECFLSLQSYCFLLKIAHFCITIMVATFWLVLPQRKPEDPKFGWLVYPVSPIPAGCGIELLNKIKTFMFLKEKMQGMQEMQKRKNSPSSGHNTWMRQK